ncbi:MAG: alpha/beta hydrolase [Firmicutes bacterium]|nr:alpha/beta hydrolase [Bacillota bacterium]
MSISLKASQLLLKTADRTGMLPSRVDDLEKEFSRAEKYNRKNRFTVPRDRKAHYREVRLAGYPCLLIRPRNTRVNKRKAILYLHGGFKNEWKPELGIARGYGKKAGVDVWYSIYPSITEVPITRTIDVIYRTFRKMAKIYGGQNIAVIGGSMGAFFAFQIINRNNRHKQPADMPGLLIANSPGGMPASEQDWQTMRRCAEKDALIGIRSVEQLKDMTASFGEAIPDHALSPVYGDFRNAPETYVYYGEETFAGNAPAYARAYKRDGSSEKLHMHIEPGGMHCYAFMPVFPESRRDYNEQIQILRDFCENKSLSGR